MTVEQTAEWIRTIGQCNNWSEAPMYAENFAKNDIWGHLLPRLTLETLRIDLNIMFSEHRQVIMMAIKYLFPSMAFSDAIMMDSQQTGSPMMTTPFWVSVMDISPCIGTSEPMDCG